MQFSSVAVSRRYKQFDWLQQRLVEKYSTIAIPPLPEKQIAGKICVQLHNTVVLYDRNHSYYIEVFCNILMSL